MATKTIVAGDELRVTVTFKEAGVPTAPTSATYRVEDVESRTVLRDDTDIPDIDASVVVTLNYADNSMHSAGAASEKRKLIVVANYGTDDEDNPRQTTDSYEYTVKRRP